ncbi:MAG: Asp-tRNA(Asn)/Glu-tRNA(Gln) amidotransferase subunit GatA [Candidatus Omnitrophica bacterium]|nr:Asp-tRNA(Asn)/Glu-tRNA(Gln) amidotransferase subunit GatA [Candidatus Omnitrophota bacterium]
MKDIFSSIASYAEWVKDQKKPLGELASYLSDRIESVDKELHAFIGIDKKAITKRAADLEAKKTKGRLWALPVGIKNNICIKDALTTCASHILDGFRPPYNATVVEKLQAADALLLDGLNMDEFAFGSSCETSYYGPTRNPWDTTRIPGGSSGGSAASVASGEVAVSLGSDTGGSIRQPASLCGVVGFKPTYGRVSRYGLIAFASSLDQIGPITRNIADCAAMLEVISGYDPKDSTSANLDVPKYTEYLDRDIKGLRIGIPKEYFISGIEPGVGKRVKEAIDVFKKLGAELVDISLPHTRFAVSCYYIVGPAEASSNLARYDGVHYGYRSAGAKDLIEMYISSRNEAFGAEAKRRILLGTYALSSGYYDAYYLKALKVRTKIAADFKEAFKNCDVILTPTSPTTAFKIGEKINDPLTMYLSDVFTIPANLAGLPAASIPCGKDEKGLPVGLQLMAPAFEETVIIKAAHAFERNTDFHKDFAGARFKDNNEKI